MVYYLILDVIHRLWSHITLNYYFPSLASSQMASFQHFLKKFSDLFNKSEYLLKAESLYYAIPRIDWLSSNSKGAVNTMPEKKTPLNCILVVLEN